MSKHVLAPTPFEALRIAIIRAGGQRNLAERLQVSQASVSSWNMLPLKHVEFVEREYGLPRHWLRPDIYPAAHPYGGRFTGVDQGVDRVDFQNRRVSKRGVAA